MNYKAYYYCINPDCIGSPLYIEFRGIDVHGYIVDGHHYHGWGSIGHG